MSRGPARARGPDRPDDVRHRRPRARDAVRPQSSRCTVNVLWVRVRDAVAGALDSMTLADLVPPRLPDATAAPTQPTPLQGALTTP